MGVYDLSPLMGVYDLLTFHSVDSPRSNNDNA